MIFQRRKARQGKVASHAVVGILTHTLGINIVLDFSAKCMAGMIDDGGSQCDCKKKTKVGNVDHKFLLARSALLRQ